MKHADTKLRKNVTKLFWELGSEANQNFQLFKNKLSQDLYESF